MASIFVFLFMNMPPRFRKLICAFLTAMGFATTGCHKTKWIWETEEEYFKLPYWDQRVKELHKREYQTGNGTFFIGDSITEGYDLYRMYGDNTIVNMGIGGDFTSGVLMRLDLVKKYQPKKVFLMIGINDILKNVPIELIQKRYAEIIDTILRDSPTTHLYIQSNLPTLNLGGNLTTNQPILDKVNQLNEFLRIQCATKGAEFIDLHTHFMKDGQLNAEYTYDGLHISEAGYQLWTQIISECVRQ